MKEEKETPFSRRLAELSETCKEMLRALGLKPAFPVGEIRINRRAKKRLGCCKLVREAGRPVFLIEISSAMENCEDAILKEVLLHELLHTCAGCLNHGPVWKENARRVNEAYGTDIRTRADTDRMPGLAKDTEETRTYQYEVRCSRCGGSVYRMRRSRITEHPENYRCGRCGGTLTVIRL